MNLSKRFHLALGVCISLAAAVVAWGQAPAAKVVYVATGGNQVYAVTPSGTPLGLIPATNTNYTGDTFSSLTVGPDNISTNVPNANGDTNFFLYACDSTNSQIVRLTLSTNPFDSNGNLVTASDEETLYNGGGTLSEPVCGRVDSEGDLYVSSGSGSATSGVYVITGASGDSPAQPTVVYTIGGSFTGGGITQKNNGDMLIVNSAGGTILRAKFDGALPANSPYSPFASALDPSAFVSGLSSPSAIARISTNDFFVANQGSGAVERFDPANLSSPTTCNASLPNGNVTLSSLAASEDNFIYVGIASTSPNKREIDILDGTTSDCGGTGATISLSNLSQAAKYVAAVAVPPVATGPNSQGAGPVVTGYTSTKYDFGSSVVETLTNGCTPVVTQSQVPLSELNSLAAGIPLTATWSGGNAIPYNGEGGFGTVYTVTPSTCTVADVYNNFIIGSLTDNTQFTNPRIIHCDTGVGCDVTDASGTWPVGGLVPDDITVGGKVPGFSRFFLVNATPVGGTEQGTFCGFGSPLTNTADGEPPAVFSSGQNLAVKFKLGAADTANSCSNGPYITDAQVMVSVARIADGSGNPVFEPVAVNSSGSSTPVPPIFNYNPTSQQYQFSLSLKGYLAGTYSITVTFLTNNTSYQTTLFKVQ